MPHHIRIMERQDGIGYTVACSCAERMPLDGATTNYDGAVSAARVHAVDAWVNSAEHADCHAHLYVDRVAGRTIAGHIFTCVNGMFTAPPTPEV